MHHPTIDPIRHAALRPRAALEVVVIGNLKVADEVVQASGHRADSMDSALRTQAETACEEVWQQLAEGMQESLGIQVGPIIEHARPKDRNRKCSEHGKHSCDNQKSVTFCDYSLRQFFNAEPPRLGILTSLTSGLGLLAAKTAVLALGATPRWACRNGVEFELEAALPFSEASCGEIKGIPRSEYLQDELADLQQLLVTPPPGESKVPWLRQVVRMDGIYVPPTQAQATAGAGDPAVVRFKAARKLAYRSAAEMMIQNADLLVAVKDPNDAAGAMELQEILDLALDCSVPVLLIDLAHSTTQFYLYDRLPASLNAPPTLVNSWKKELKEKVHYLMALPQMIELPGEKCYERVKRQELLAQTVDRLLRLYGDRPEHSICDGRLRMPILKAAWSWLHGLSKKCVGWPHGHSYQDEPDEARDKMNFPDYQKWYDKGSMLASNYMSVYRGFFVLSFVLAAVAVMIAVLAISLALYHNGHVPAWMCILAPIKAAILFLLLKMSNASHRHPPQELAADFRYFTEVLRPMEWLAPLGASMPTVELPAHHRPQDPRQGWTQWLLRAISRSTPSAIRQKEEYEVVDMDAKVQQETLESAAKIWVTNQIHYHYGRAQTMHHLENGLVRINKALLIVVLVAVGIIMAVELLPHLLGAFIPFFHQEPDHHSWQMVTLGAITATLPAIIAALTGIMFQSEAAALELQSEAMFLQLKETKEVLLKMSHNVGTPSPASLGCESWKAAQHLRNVARMMIIETGDWRALYQLHEVHAG